MKITGTFLDEITYDIPAANWGPREWAREFDTMKSIGIDTVILIRAGLKNRMTFDSKVLKSYATMMPADEDLVDIFLKEAERCRMDFFFGTYDSDRYWRNGDYNKEMEINLKFTEEAVQRYGRYPAFKGWYISLEMIKLEQKAIDLYFKLAAHLKQLKNLPILVSPVMRGSQDQIDPAKVKEHEQAWDHIFAQVAGKVDLVAFQDGCVQYLELPGFLEVTKRLADKYKITLWTNVETFDRGMPIKFPPISWPCLRYKLEAAKAVGIEKAITFEFSHFLSPNSIYPAAHNLFQRYKEWIEKG